MIVNMNGMATTNRKREEKNTENNQTNRILSNKKLHAHSAVLVHHRMLLNHNQIYLLYDDEIFNYCGQINIFLPINIKKKKSKCGNENQTEKEK